VGRAHHLRQTLDHNAALVDRLLVVTHPADRQTIEVVSACPAAALALSDSCFAGGHAFNKGRMINAALARLDKPDWILLTDADVFLPTELPEFIRTHSLNPGVLYGASRYDVAAGSTLATNLVTQTFGDFQLFHPRASAIAARWPAVMCEEFCSAGGVDSWFMLRFAADQRFVIPELAVRHIAHSEILGQDWNGPPRSGQWRQFAMLTTRGLALTEPLTPNATGTRRVRLVDTVFGLPWEGTAVDGQPLAAEVVQIGPAGMVWLGRPIGFHHIHCAYWRE